MPLFGTLTMLTPVGLTLLSTMKNVLLFSLLFVGFTGLWGQDLNEPNNSFATATVVTLVDLSAQVDGAINPTGDLDFYRVEVPRAGVLVADVTNVTGGIEMEITLFDSTQREILQRVGSDEQPINLTELSVLRRNELLPITRPI